MLQSGGDYNEERRRDVGPCISTAVRGSFVYAPWRLAIRLCRQHFRLHHVPSTFDAGLVSNVIVRRKLCRLNYVVSYYHTSGAFFGSSPSGFRDGERSRCGDHARKTLCALVGLRLRYALKQSDAWTHPRGGVGETRSRSEEDHVLNVKK